MRSALIDSGGIVRDVVLVGPGWTPPPGLIVVASETAGIGFSYDGSTFSAPVSASSSKQELLAYLAKRQDMAMAGVFSFDVPGGPTLDTRSDPASAAYLGMLAAWVISNVNSPAATRNFYNLDGSALSVTQAQFSVFLNAFGEWMQSIFDAAGAIAAAIKNGSITTVAQIDSAAWPVND